MFKSLNGKLKTKSKKQKSAKTNGKNMKNEDRKMKNSAEVPAWWLELPEAEKAVIRDVLVSIRSLKASQSRPVATAARKWERSIACFIKFRLKNQSGKGRKRAMGLMGQMGRMAAHAQPATNTADGVTVRAE